MYPQETYMRRAIKLAQKGAGRVNPNPMVGAVVVKNGQIIGEGFHQQYGGLHAERNALADCREDPRGATLYVTLEPCCHYGKTPPCTEAIIEQNIAQVIYGSADPNPLINGKGAEILRQAGIQVTGGFLQDECDQINKVFFHYITCGTPYVTMKYAMTIDGKIATYTGRSRWITGSEARKQVHLDRNRNMAIMTGVGTVLADDPLLTCRIEGGRNPVRIICDSRLSTPLTSQIVSTASSVPTIIATCCDEPEKLQPYREKGCRMISVASDDDGHVCLPALMKILGGEKIDSILLEGGNRLNWSALSSGIVQNVQAYISPKIFGGEQAKTPVGGEGAAFPSQAVLLDTPKITRIGEDILLESEVKPCSPASLKKSVQ